VGRFLLRRLAYLIVLVVIATAATYLLAAVALNPRSNFEGRNPPPPPEVVDARLDELNLNDKTPITDRFTRWVSGLVRSDLGLTVDGGSVNDEMGRRVWVSLRLLLIGSLLGTLAGVAAGAYSAVKQYNFSDHAITLVSFVILSVNTVVLAVFLANAGTSFNNAVGNRVVYNTGEYSPGLEGWTSEGIVDRLKHLILPSLVLVLQGFAFYSRYQRNSMLDVLGSDFVRTARSVGLPWWRVVVTYALRNAILPVITIAGIVFSTMLGANVLVEKVFSWPGVASYALDALLSSDYAPVQGFVLLMATVFVIVNLLVDILYGIADPRVTIG